MFILNMKTTAKINKKSRERQRQRQRDRQRETDRQTNKDTQREREGNADQLQLLCAASNYLSLLFHGKTAGLGNEVLDSFKY